LNARAFLFDLLPSPVPRPSSVVVRTGSGRWGRGFAGFLPNVVWCIPVLEIVGRSSSFRLNVSLGIMSYLNKRGELSCFALLGNLLVGYLLLFSVVMRHYSRCLFGYSLLCWSIVACCSGVGFVTRVTVKCFRVLRMALRYMRRSFWCGVSWSSVNLVPSGIAASAR